MEFEITKENFDEIVLNNKGLVLIDFWATWCGPCMMQAPVIEELAEELDDVTVGKIDVDADGELAVKYGVSSIPTLMLFKDGECVSTNVGYHTKNQLLDIIEKYR
ncbi:MAG: thioredoxin [Acutalibacteraceae bacterium]|nr:thioredoxin [Acutalibacteraceae bacterium]